MSLVLGLWLILVQGIIISETVIKLVVFINSDVIRCNYMIVLTVEINVTYGLLDFLRRLRLSG